MNLERELEKLKPELIALRRDFHQYPELGFKEFRTQKKIITYLNTLDIQTEEIAWSNGRQHGHYPKPSHRESGC